MIGVKGYGFDHDRTLEVWAHDVRTVLIMLKLAGFRRGLVWVFDPDHPLNRIGQSLREATEREAHI